MGRLRPAVHGGQEADGVQDSVVFLPAGSGGLYWWRWTIAEDFSESVLSASDQPDRQPEFSS